MFANPMLASLIPMFKQKLEEMETEEIPIEMEGVDFDIEGTIRLRTSGKVVKVTAKTDHGKGTLAFIAS